MYVKQTKMKPDGRREDRRKKVDNVGNRVVLESIDDSIFQKRIRGASSDFSSFVVAFKQSLCEIILTMIKREIHR